MNYVELMRDQALAAHDVLFDGVGSVTYLAFPDHGNVGDSAIALGMLAYLRSRDIHVRTIQSVGSAPESLGPLSGNVLFQGGGNLGGLYPHVDDYRERALRAMRDEAVAIHGPQSVHVVDEAGAAGLRTVTSRVMTRLAVRDRSSLAAVSHVHGVCLSPDSVHVLGEIAAPAPTRPVVVLARTDDEARTGVTRSSVRSVDWLQEGMRATVARRARWQYRRLGLLGRRLEPSSLRWERLAQRRFERGVELLSAGEVIVTDRLHAMLIALQMGRSVIAIDNANRKLSNYAETWLGDASSDRLSFAADARSALARLGVGG